MFVCASDAGSIRSCPPGHYAYDYMPMGEVDKCDIAIAPSTVVGGAINMVICID
jgi:hypothetical protein